MKVHILFAQRMEDYEGQYAPEAVDAIDEFTLVANPQYCKSSKKTVLEKGTYISAEWFIVNLRDIVNVGDVAGYIRKVLLQKREELSGELEQIKSSDIRDLSITVTPKTKKTPLATPDF